MAVATANTPSLSQETRDSVAKSLEQKGFSQTFAREVDRLSTENRERIARGELPNEAQYVFSVENMNPITDAKGMDTIVTIGSLLPRADEKTLGLPDTLNESTYEATLDELFKTTDRDIWLRNTDKTELTQKQKDRDRERLAEDRTRYTARLAEFKA